MTRPRNVTLALALTLVLATATVAFRGTLAADLWSRADMEALSALALLEGLVVGGLAIPIAVLCFAPRRLPFLLLRAVYVVWIVDAVAWALLTPLVGTFVALVLDRFGHANRAAALFAATVARWTWVVIKVALSAGLLTVVHRQGGAWVRRATSA